MEGKNQEEQKTGPGTRYFLKTKRLGFRHWKSDDLELAQGLWGDGKVMRFIDKRGALSESQVRVRLQQEIKNQLDHRVQYWPIFLLQTHTHVGCAGLKPYDKPRGIFEMGFQIRSKYWGSGYASEAARTVVRFAFSALPVAGLFAGHNYENLASRNLLNKLGFRYTHDELYQPTGQQEASYLLMAQDVGTDTENQPNMGTIL